MGEGQFTSQSERRHTYFVYSLQMTQRKASLRHNFSSSVAGIELATSSSRGQRANHYSCGFRGGLGVSVELPLGPNYFIFMRNFEKKWAKWLNVLNRTPLFKFEPAMQTSWIRTCTRLPRSLTFLYLCI